MDVMSFPAAELRTSSPSLVSKARRHGVVNRFRGTTKNMALYYAFSVTNAPMVGQQTSRRLQDLVRVFVGSLCEIVCTDLWVLTTISSMSRQYCFGFQRCSLAAWRIDLHVNEGKSV